MTTKVDQVSAVEPRRLQTTVITTSSAVSVSSPKVSMFGAKTGFVIPKNKLSGSLVPIFRGGGKLEGNDAVKEESAKPVQRKTKWGTDLTQDAAVRRGRALAYETRVEQITKQLKSGVLESRDDQGLQSPTEVPNDESSRQMNSELQKLELLELERRDAIGEILKLNPSYKAPPDYKPLLKEATVPIPLKAYPGYNFIRLLLGPGSNTLKRLEEETGAKIRVRGTKAGTGEKGEVTLSNENEVLGAYEELYVHVSADTYDKVDAAVSLIELLVKPVSGNPVVSTTPTSVSADGVNVINQSQDLASSYMMPVTGENQGVLLPIMRPTQRGPSHLFQPYPSSWFPVGPPQPYGFMPPPNSSASTLTNNPSNMPAFFGGRPPTAAGLSSVPRNPSFVTPRPQLQMQVTQQPYMPEARPLSHVPPRTHFMPGPQTPPAYAAIPSQPNPTIPLPFSGNQPTPTVLAPVARPPVHSMPQFLSTIPSGPLPNRPLTPAGSSTGWSGASAVTSVSVVPGNMMQIASPQRPHPVVIQHPIASVALASNMSITVSSRAAAANMVSPASFPSRPLPSQILNAPVYRSAAVPPFVFAPSQTGSSIASSMSSVPSVTVSVPAVAPASASLLSAVHSPASGQLPAPTPTFSRAATTVFTQEAGATPAPAPAPAQSFSAGAPPQPAMIRAPVPSPSPNLVMGSAPGPSPMPSTSQPLSTISGGLPSFTPIKPPQVTAPKPQRSTSSDFTFQPLGPQVPHSQTVPRPNSQSVVQNTPPMPPRPAVQPPMAPQAPSFRLVVHNLGSQPSMQGFPRSQITNQMGHPQSPVPPPSPSSLVPFSGSPTALPPPPPRISAFQNPHPVLPTSPVPQMGPRNFGSVPQRPLRPTNSIQMQMQQNQLAPANQPVNHLAANQQLNNNIAFASRKMASSPSRGHQIYDPFSPTSVASTPSQGDNPAKASKQENDPEYEDLMASVGVK